MCVVLRFESSLLASLSWASVTSSVVGHAHTAPSLQACSGEHGCCRHDRVPALCVGPISTGAWTDPRCSHLDWWLCEILWLLTGSRDPECPTILAETPSVQFATQDQGMLPLTFRRFGLPPWFPHHGLGAQNAAEETFEALDANGDGVISRQEWVAAFGEHSEGRASQRSEVVGYLCDDAYGSCGDQCWYGSGRSSWPR